MAGFFLGGGGGSSQQQQQQRGEQHGGGGIPPSESFFLYGAGSRGGSRGEDVAYGTRGFELWQQHQIQREHQLYSTAGFPDELPSVAGRPMRGVLGGAAAGGISCQDCGNQAKKDCAHMRCRTCCKSRGFQCPTHVKSTWVPAAKRRERQQQLSAAAAAVHLDQHRHRSAGASGARSAGEGSSEGAEPSKRPRELTVCTRIPTAIATTTTTTTYGGSLDPESSFPPEVSAPAVFRCVRVSHVDEEDDVYAYHTAVSIGGHVFKGLLYDHGPEGEYPSSSSSRYHLHHGEGSSSPAAAAAAAAATAAITNAGEAAAATATAATTTELLEPYPTPLTAFMAGTQFFPHQQRP